MSGKASRPYLWRKGKRINKRRLTRCQTPGCRRRAVEQNGYCPDCLAALGL